MTKIMTLSWKRIAVLAAVSIALGGCRMSAPEALELFSGSSKDFGQLFEDAKALQERGKRNAAIIHLKRAIQQAPNDPSLRFALGQLFNDSLDGLSAEKELLKAHELGLDEGGKVRAAIARAMWLQGDYVRLVHMPSPAEDLGPAVRAEIHVYRGQAFAARGRLAEAKEALAQAREALGKAPLPLVDVLEASIRWREKDPDAALAKVADVLKTEPRMYDALILKAGILRLRGDNEAAITAYREVLQAHPLSLVALVAHSTLLLQSGQFDEAETAIQALQTAHPNNFITHFQGGLLRFRKAQYKTALESFQRSLALAPRFMDGILYEGVTQLALGSLRSAERSLLQYVTARPGDRLGRKMLAITFVQLNESARALEVMSPILDRGEQAPDIWELAADAYARMGNYPLAGAWMSKAAAAKPSDGSVREKQAKLHLKGGDTELAIAELENAIALRARPSTAGMMLAVLHLSRREFDKASAALDVVEKEVPDSPFAANLRGILLLEAGQREAAVKVFQDILITNPDFLPAVSNLVKLDLQDGQPDIARRRLEAVLTAEKNHLQAMLLLAELEHQVGHTVEALALLERAARIHQSALDPRARLIERLVRQGRLKEARTHADEALFWNPTSLAAYELLASVQMSSRDAQGAVATFNRLVEVHPKSARAHYSKGRAEYAAGMVAEAEASLRNAIALDKSYGAAHTALIELLMRQKRSGPALEFAKALQKDLPKSPAGLTLEGDIQVSLKNYKEAVTAFRAALALAPTDGTAVRLYRAQVAAGDRKAALNDLRDWVANHPKSPHARTQLATALLDVGDIEGATKEFEAVAQAAPKDPVVMTNLAWAYYKAGDPRALTLAEDALRLRPGDPAISNTLGWILLQQGDVARATELLARAAKGLPNEPSVRYRYASGLAKSGNPERARAEVSSALSLDKPFPEREQAVALLRELNR